MVSTSGAGAGDRAVAPATARADRRWLERLVALLHLLTSFALSLGYVVPALLLVTSTVWLGTTVAGTLSGFLVPPSASRLAGGAVLFLLLAPAGATLLARLACATQRARLASVYGIVETRTPDPTAPVSGTARLFRYTYGSHAWSALVYSTVAALVGILSGVVVLGLVGLGIGGSAGALLGLGFATVEGSFVQAVDESPLVLAFVVFGPPAAVLGLWLVPSLLRLEVAVTRRLLFDAPEVQVRRQLVHLRESRLRMVDAAEAERRRIERDLHDGAQQRLLAVTLTLGRARSTFDRDPAAARDLMDQARSEAREVMSDLRDVARGLHPKVLTDHGLEAALPVAVDRCPLSTRLDVQLTERPSHRAEGVAYYVTCEALNNVVKHSGAQSASVSVTRLAGDNDDLLRLVVTDDGIGGATPEAGTGLNGLWDRVDAVDGHVRLHSPEGEGTVLTVDIPWEA